MFDVVVIIKKIEQHVILIDGLLNYNCWGIAFSSKDLNQFNYDTSVPIDHTKEVGNINTENIIELRNSINSAGIEIVVDEINPINVFIYKLRSFS